MVTMASALVAHIWEKVNDHWTARCFVPYYAQRISHAIVMNGAAGILGQIKKKSAGSGLGGRACGAL